MKTNNGGPAFPYSMHPDHGYGPAASVNEGMTMRAYIAAQALTGLLQNSQYPASEVAKSAVSFADALIAELEPKQET